MIIGGSSRRSTGIGVWKTAMGNVYEHRGHPSIKGGMYSKVAFWKNQLDHSGRWWRPQIKITKIIAQKLKTQKKAPNKKGGVPSILRLVPLVRGKNKGKASCLRGYEGSESTGGPYPQYGG